MDESPENHKKSPDRRLRLSDTYSKDCISIADGPAHGIGLQITEPAMDGHRRMARTLACLVASMTLGAVVLDWFQPPRPAAPLTGTELIARHVRQAIQRSAQGSIVPHRWRAIRIDPWHLGSDSEADDIHFVIDRAGGCCLTEGWRVQKPLGPTGVVRIGLLASRQSNEITRSQKSAADDLIRVLQQECNIPGQKVDWDDTLAVPPPAQPFCPERAS